MSAEGPLPLSGLLAVEVSGSLSGALCGKILADLGARVIKLEPLGGDPPRRIGPFGNAVRRDETGAFHLFVNSGKESLALDLSHSDGRDIFESLLERTDVLLLSGDMADIEATGIVPETLSSEFEQLIVTRVTPFGVEGPHSRWKSDDIVLYAMSGWMHMTGAVDGPPMASGGNLARMASGLAAASATLMALNEREGSGRGQVVDVAEQEVLALMQPYTMVGYSYTGIERPRNGMPFPMTIVPAADGYLGINVLTQAQWEALCAFTGLLDLLEEERFSTPTLRAEHAWELTERFAEWARDQKKAEVFAAGQEWRVPFGYVPKVNEIRELDQHVAREFFTPVEHPHAGSLVFPSMPFTIDGQRIGTSRAPLRGEHTAPILEQELGIPRDDIVRLAELGATL